MLQKYGFITALCLSLAISDFAGGFWLNGVMWQSKWDSRDKADALAVVATQEAERKKERQWQDDLQKVHDDAKKRQDIIAADAAELSDVAGKLRKQIRRMSTGQQGENSTVADISRAAATDKIVLSELLSWSVGANEQLARYADQNREAALACNAAYNAIR